MEGGGQHSTISTEFTTGKTSSHMIALIVLRIVETAAPSSSSSPLLFLRHPEVPLPQRLLSGASQRHQDVRRGGDFPTWETGEATDGLL